MSVVQKTVEITYWDCGVSACKTKHTTEIAATRCCVGYFPLRKLGSKSMEAAIERAKLRNQRLSLRRSWRGLVIEILNGSSLNSAAKKAGISPSSMRQVVSDTFQPLRHDLGEAGFDRWYEFGEIQKCRAMWSYFGKLCDAVSETGADLK
jgi:hypothetical protein